MHTREALPQGPSIVTMIKAHVEQLELGNIRLDVWYRKVAIGVSLLM